MSRSTTHTVTDPVYVHQFPQAFRTIDGDVDELPVRKPNGLDMIEIGTPVIYDSATGKAELDIPKCYEMTSRLSNMPTKVLLGIDPGEMLDLFWMIASFFMKGRQALLPALERQKEELLRQLGSPEPSPGDTTPASP